ncbi:hypothetical protein GM1_012_00990 [Gordonia malaquae NBRC 108250]|uniref:Uncharacterized protein n=2 Tax=Gordonia malaquae TaxID=410332 RepID=M3TEJ9_GORML|nr:hypothetical protein GM1_012_00990 [Gordonia malaquae NBRC 108250]
MFREVEGVVTAEWSKEVRIGSRVVVDAPPPMAEECALGYLLAGAFGTGAQLMGPSLVSGLMNALMPG